MVLDELFPEVDLALRRGRHLDRDDLDAYGFLVDAQPFLEDLYRRYGCALVQADGYFFLKPSGERLGRRVLSIGEMLVGQALALLYLDPATLKERGVVPRVQVIARLTGLVGEARLIHALNFRRRKSVERVAEETLRAEIDKALRSLSAMGFLDLLDEERLRIRCPVIRFTDPVRGLDDASRSLERLLADGSAVELPQTEEPDPERTEDDV